MVFFGLTVTVMDLHLPSPNDSRALLNSATNMLFGGSLSSDEHPLTMTVTGTTVAIMRPNQFLEVKILRSNPPMPISLYASQPFAVMGAFCGGGSESE